MSITRSTTSSPVLASPFPLFLHNTHLVSILKPQASVIVPLRSYQHSLTWIQIIPLLA